jgi:hypothetical protein
VPLVEYDAVEHALADDSNEVDTETEEHEVDDKVKIGIVPETERLCFELSTLV